MGRGTHAQRPPGSHCRCQQRGGKGKEKPAGPCLLATPKNCLPCRGISVLEKLIKMWLQLGLSKSGVTRILHWEMAGMFLNRRDSNLKHLMLHVHFPSLSDSSSEVLESTIFGTVLASDLKAFPTNNVGAHGSNTYMISYWLEQLQTTTYKGHGCFSHPPM